MLTFLTDEVYPVETVLEAGFQDAAALAELRRLQDLAKQAGLWALGHPANLGGGGLSLEDYLYVNEVVGMSEYAMFVFGTHTLHDAMMLDAYAPPYWRETYLEPLVDGRVASPAFAMTERDVSGSDPTQIQSRATLEGDEWVIHGHKWFTTHAHAAEFTVVMVRTEDDGRPHDRFSMLIVPSDAKGYEVLRTVPTMGETDGDHCEVTYDGVRVPKANLLGERGAGFRIAQERLGPGRLFHCMRFLGQAERAFDLLCARATTRSVKGGLLADLQLIQKMVFDSLCQVTTTRLLVLEAARLLDTGEDARSAIGMAKVTGARTLHDVIDRAIQVHGSLGVSDDLPLARMYRNARYARIYDGADETHIVNVAQRILRTYSYEDRP
jgi:alkylation response protein AidB-like acyl-CoA dehydrogenase